jgi:DGQHR domain-containing protein
LATKKSTPGKLRYSVSLVTQGNHKFYTFTMPSDVLARTCFVTSRDEDPKKGFQRVLDRQRAEQIAQYIDSGFGTIPTSIILSAQPDAELRTLVRGKTVEFNDTPRAFLVLDGQHRVYGFSIAKTALRVPVVVYNGLSRQDETRLFIDINTKQRPVPNELLLDIKKLADYESETEQLLGELYDLFNDSTSSPLLGLMSPATRASGKISRVTFNAAVKPLVGVFTNSDVPTIYAALSRYIAAFYDSAKGYDLPVNMSNSTTFRAIMLLFSDVAQRVKDKHGADYTIGNFEEVMAPMFSRLKVNAFRTPGNSPKELHQTLLKALREEFTL